MVAMRGCVRCRCLVIVSAAAMTEEGISPTALPENILPCTENILPAFSSSGMSARVESGGLLLALETEGAMKFP